MTDCKGADSPIKFIAPVFGLANTTGTTKRLKHVDRRFYRITRLSSMKYFQNEGDKKKEFQNHENNGYMNIFTVK